jgi:hypothetical protein
MPLTLQQIDNHNQAILNGLNNTGYGAVNYIHARYVLAIAPTPQMVAIFDPRAHRGMINLYNNQHHTRMIYASHSPADRAEFEDAIHRLPGYHDWEIDYY